MMAAFRLDLEGRTIVAARIAFGGMAATPKRAATAELALAGASLDDPASWQAALDALASDYAPITDMRATADYRKHVSRSLLRKALVEIAGAPAETTRIHAREAAHG